MRTRFMKTHFSMCIFSSSHLQTLGMVISSSIYRIWRSLYISWGMSDDTYVIMLRDTLSSMTLYIIGLYLVSLFDSQEAKAVCNDCHSGACGGHLSKLATTQNILREGYYWPLIFKDCVNAVKRCHLCQVLSQNMHSHLSPLHTTITIGTFMKWGVYFMDCNPTSAGGTIILL